MIVTKEQVEKYIRAAESVLGEEQSVLKCSSVLRKFIEEQEEPDEWTRVLREDAIED